MKTTWRRLLLPLALCVALFAQQAQENKEEQKKEEPQKEEAKPAGSPTPAPEGTFSGFIEICARAITNVRGDYPTYRSLVNLAEGLRLPALELNFQKPGARLLDSMHLSANSWGDPYNTARLDAGKQNLYRFVGSYSNVAYYNYLPSFANPQIPSVPANERAYDTRIRNVDTELQLFPGTRFMPYFAYSRNTNEGNGITPLWSMWNEYPLRENIDYGMNTYRGGVRMDFTRAHVTVEHGANSFWDRQLDYSTGQLTGNRQVPYLGQQLLLTAGSIGYNVDGSGRFTRVLFTSNPYNWLDLYGQVLYSNPRTTADVATAANGDFYTGVSGTLFAPRLIDTLFGQGDRPHTSGSFSFEVRPVRRLRVRQMFETDRIKTDTAGTSLIQYLSLSGSALAALQSSPVDRLESSDQRETVEVLYDALKSVTLRGGYRYEWGNAVLRGGSLNEINPQERLDLVRHVGLAGLRYRPVERLTLNADAEASNGVRTYYRTGLQDYFRVRVQGRYQALSNLFLTSTYFRMQNRNPAPGVDSRFDAQTSTLGLQWLPNGGKRISILADYARSTVSSDLSYIVPFPFDTLMSLYRDRSNTGTLLADLSLPGSGVVQPKLSLGGSFVTTAGSRPSRYYQPMGRFQLPLHRHVMFFSEWRYYGFNQPYFYTFETFRTHTVMTGLRWTL
jgi:hypothetical protein